MQATASSHTPSTAQRRREWYANTLDTLHAITGKKEQALTPRTDIKALTSDEPALLPAQSAAFKKYHEEQFTTVKLPGAAHEVVISPFNELGDGRYYDTASSTAFAFDYATQVRLRPAACPNRLQRRLDKDHDEKKSKH